MAATVLVIGSGGREHALVWKLAQSPKVGRICVAPGNGGTCQIAENIPIQATDINALLSFARARSIDLTIVGPDDPLALGIVDVFRRNGLAIFGPTQAAAVIESSKAAAKDMMHAANIPAPHSRIFWDYEKASSYIKTQTFPMVIKANGLALGKGVYVCKTADEAKDALIKIMVGRVHGQAGDCVIAQEFLYGQEVSVHAFCDGNTVKLLPLAQDHKPVFDGDLGNNTGGMGTICPVPWIKEKTMQQVQKQIVGPILSELARCNREFTGLLYPGLMITTEGPKVLEFNARFGDPETQVYMRLLQTDLFGLLCSCVNGTLADVAITWKPGFAACIVLASRGYPGEYRKGFAISGIREAEKLPGVVVFHAGTTHDGARLKTSGGRVLGVSAVGETLQESLDRAYQAAALICFEGVHYRKDIGKKALTMS